jgi:hypothetical protein
VIGKSRLRRGSVPLCLLECLGLRSLLVRSFGSALLSAARTVACNVGAPAADLPGVPFN